MFARYFFEVWDALEASASAAREDVPTKPVYFRFLTLMSWHVFLKEGVDAAIYEVGVGGAWDSTNVVQKPIVTGITTLGIDHVAVLGDTLAKIAWHKAGIFKKGVPAFSVPQDPEVVEVLKNRAFEIGVQYLHFINIDPFVYDVNVVPDADYQRGNISLAIALVVAAAEKLGLKELRPDIRPEVFKGGLEQTVWRGRCETKFDGPRRWRLDGAHTVNSLKVAAQWFAAQQVSGSDTNTLCILVFNQQKRPGPEADELLRGLQHELINNCGIRFDHVIFSTNATAKSTGYRIGIHALPMLTRDTVTEFEDRNASTQAVKELTVQKRFAEVWAEADKMAKIHVTSTIQEAVELAQALSDEPEATEILVTGSIHLVGGVLALLEGVSDSRPGSSTP
ncbi:Folylpolyglutamate synthase [Exophiala dermatitidis]|uniref:tetrahydrofolate synthase n=1 Tax=Exophiala dermatitidis (strain ATCC 34100 / CBS 525.76 / NIH/UT8656) TaxID=858893 RepID=H6BWY7_EXODN|nr:folylpolyglutamate synthase [Exophiala dermatitidis NIH/UT8656]EHY56144.1 folylpolyglutamate synthase [Exophiala dermatitidis NIH/UT8656]